MAVQRLHVAKRFSEIAISGNLVHLAGQLASDFSLDIKGQTQQIFDIIDQFLADAGTDKREFARKSARFNGKWQKVYF